MSQYEKFFKQQARRPETFFLRKGPVNSDEEWTPEKVQEGAIATQVGSDVQKLDGVFRLVKTQDFRGAGQKEKEEK